MKWLLLINATVFAAWLGAVYLGLRKVASIVGLRL